MCVCARYRYRWIVALFVHVGVLHLLVMVVAQLAVGLDLERVIGWHRILPIYLISGIGGYVIRSVKESMMKRQCDLVFTLALSLLFSSAIFLSCLRAPTDDKKWDFHAVPGGNGAFPGSVRPPRGAVC